MEQFGRCLGGLSNHSPVSSYPQNRSSHQIITKRDRDVTADEYGSEKKKEMNDNKILQQNLAFATGAKSGGELAAQVPSEIFGVKSYDTKGGVTASTRSGAWGAVGSMALCVALLIAAEFMPVSLLTPIAGDLGTTAGMAGQAISISGLFAVVTSLCIATFAAHFDRRYVLVGLTGVMLASLVLIAIAPNFILLMTARALLGIVIGGFWALATATVMRLVPEESVPKALGLVYTGNAVATAFAAPIGSYVGGIIGWRGVFWALMPIVVINLVWQWTSLPAMPPQTSNPIGKVFGLLKRRSVAFAMLGVMLTFAGAFATFTYLRPFLETRTQVSVPQLSLLLLGLGLAGFAGTYGATAFAKTRLRFLLSGLPVALGIATLCLLTFQHSIWAVGLILIAWGTLNSAIPVSWSTWLTKGIADEPESGGGLMVAAIQLSIMLGGAFGGYLLDSFSIGATFVGGTLLLFAGAAVVKIGGFVSENTRTNAA
jgi:predicted MFS family arabinose efflux permease